LYQKLCGCQNTFSSVGQDIARNTNAIFGDGVPKGETYFGQLSCQSLISLENAMLFEVELLLFFVHLGINYFGFLCECKFDENCHVSTHLKYHWTKWNTFCSSGCNMKCSFQELVI
jgi:hypothetical protein